MRNDKYNNNNSRPKNPVTGQAPAKKNIRPIVKQKNDAAAMTIRKLFLVRDRLGVNTASNKISFSMGLETT